jgi:hypothetical protein
MHNHMSKQQVFRLQHQVVRDLAWSLWGPALLNHPAPYNEVPDTNHAFFPLDWPWLQQLDHQPQALVDYLSQKNTRLLGTYFEALWQFYFSHHPSFDLSICNLQVNDTSRTVGEFDVLVTNHQGQNFHIELTCKFYLEWQDNLQTIFWIGPNCGDRLDIKYDKTHNHQLPLLKTELGQKVCTEQYFNTDAIQQVAIWRGTAFDRDHWFQVDGLENGSALEEWKYDNKVLWFIADKRFWLSPIMQNRDALKPYCQIKQQINDHFQQPDNADKQRFTLMLIALTFDKTNQQWQQQQRFFITANNWPYGKLADSASTPLRPCKPPL